MMSIDKLLAEIEQNSGYVPVTVAEVVRFAQLVRAADEMARDVEGQSWGNLVTVRNYRKLREGGGT